MKKILVSTLACTTLLSGITPAITNHSNVALAEETFVISEKVKNNPQYQALSTERQDDFITIAKLSNLNEKQQMDLLKKVADVRGISSDGIVTEGRITVTLKAARVIWDTLPAPVKKKFGTQAKFYAALKGLDHFTGEIEKAIYKMYKDVGLSDHYAYWATKATTLVLL